MMISTQPWDVRHIYTTADPMYDNVSSWSYLTILTKSLREHARAGRVRFLRGCGVSASPDIGPALLESRRGELVIIDLHGWKHEPTLGVTDHNGEQLPSALPSKSWSASVIFLTGCWGSTDMWGAALDKLLAHPTTVIGNSKADGAGWRDHSPISLIGDVLEQTAGADASGARDAVRQALRNDPDMSRKGWEVHSRG
jgi:hypothetical protein